VPDIQNCLINNVRVYGVVGTGPHYGIGAAILYSGLNVSHSGITNCYVKDVGKDTNLSPGDGVELKFTGPGCYVDNCYVENAIQGFGFADDGAGAECEEVRFSNCHAKNCTSAVTGTLNNSVISNIIIDMDDDATLLEPMQINGTGSSYNGIIIRGLANTPKFHLRFIGVASRNYVQVAEIYNNNNARAIASFQSGCLDNVVVVENMTTPAIPSMTTSGIVSDSNTDRSRNRVSVNQLTRQIARTIASGAIGVSNWTQVVVIETEGGAATDDLDTITGGVDGQMLVLRTTSNARDVIVKHNVGNIKLVGSADFTITTRVSSMVLVFRAGDDAWSEISRTTVPT
jgi:hypothetical protein